VHCHEGREGAASFRVPEDASHDARPHLAGSATARGAEHSPCLAQVSNHFECCKTMVGSRSTVFGVGLGMIVRLASPCEFLRASNRTRKASASCREARGLSGSRRSLPGSSGSQSRQGAWPCGSALADWTASDMGRGSKYSRRARK
jgi:hypothetical protein